MLERSIRSLALTAAEPSRLRFHVYAENASALPAALARLRAEAPEAMRGLRAHTTDSFAPVTTTDATPSHRHLLLLPKLRVPAEYMRFYLPAALRALARKILYLDVRTVALHDVGALYDAALSQSSWSVAAGVQRADVCRLGKLLNVSDARAQQVRPSGWSQKQWAAAPCLASVMLVIDVQRWLARNTTAAVESWLAQNAQRRMWKLGSLPPLMLALGQHWERLPPAALPVSY